MEQQRWNDKWPDPVRPNKPHMACLLLLDTSGSMNGAPIKQLNEAINGFKSAVLQEPATKDILEVAILTFDNSTTVVQPFVPIDEMKLVNLRAEGQTFMVPAIEMAISMITERVKLYEKYTTPYKPWIVMISDGVPNDYDGLDRIVNVIHKMEDDQKLNFFSLGVQDYDRDTLRKISRERALALSDQDFSKFFDWLNKSMRAVSHSSPGETVKLAADPSNVRLLTMADLG